MKKKIIVSICTSIILYLLVAFVKFDIAWIRELPSYSDGDRAFCLFVWCGWQFCAQLATGGIKMNN